MLECPIHKGTLLQNWTRYASCGTVTSIYCPICSPELHAEHLHAAQQGVKLTSETLRDFLALFDPEDLSGLEADSTPPTSH